MKGILFLVALGLCQVSTYVVERHPVDHLVLPNHVGTQTLDDLLNQFFGFVPFDQVVDVVKKYMANDPDVKQAWEFLQSAEFHKLIDTVRGMPEYKEFVQYLNDAGFDLYKYLNFLRAAFGLPPIDPPKFRSAKESGIIVMVNEILSLLPIQDIKNWYHNVCEPDPDFQAFLAKIRSQEFLVIVDKVFNSQQYKELTDIMRQQGIDVAAIEQAIYNFFHNARGEVRASLDDLFNQFLGFLPFDKIVEVVKRYMETDPDVKQAWEFLQSAEFHKLIDTVRAMPEYKEFVKFLMDAGYDLYKYLNLLRASFGLPPIDPPKFRSAKESGIIVMVNEILSLLPVQDIKNWYHNVCEPDPDFQAFLAKIRSQEFLVIVDKVFNSQQYTELTDIMKQQGIDVAAIEQAIYNFFHNARGEVRASLDDLFNQFLGFLPFDKIVEVVKRYMETDPDVKQAWEFLQSAEFHKLIDTVRAMPEYKEFVKFLMDAGYDLYKYLNLLRASFGLPPIDPPKFRIARESGILVMVNEILSLLPIQDIKNWYHNVCEPDPHFQAFLAKIRSQEFLVIVDKVFNSQQYTELTDIMKQQGIDVAAIEQAIYNFFHNARGEVRASLDDLFNQFLGFLPFDKIVEVVKRYMETDPDVKQAWEFLQSAEFHKLIDTVRAMSEYKEFVKFLMDAGYDLYKYLNLLRASFGLPPIDPPKFRIARESGILVMVNEILSLLPIQDIKNWYHNVCEPDPHFQAFLAKIRSQEFLVIVDKVFNSQQYTELTDIMKQQGIDVAAIEQAIYNFFHNARGEVRASLDDLFNQFLGFLPFDKIVEVVKRYMETDPDVKQAWEFLQSAEFHKLIDTVRAMPEYKEFVKFLMDAGYDLYKYLNLLRASFGLPPIDPPKFRSAKESGIILMVKEILTLLPVQDIKNWYHNVCEPDPVFQAFLAKLRSPEFLKIVLAVYNSPQYQELTAIMTAQGIDVAAIEEVIRNFFQNSRREVRASLDELFNQFLGFIPFDKIVEVVKRYMETDPDVKQAWEFLQSAEFHKLIDTVRAMPEYKEFVKFLMDAGYDLYKYLNLLRASFGLPPIDPPKFRSAKESGIILMVKEILSLLPVQDIKNWYHNVCEPDPVFQAFLAKLRSPEFLKIVLAVYNSPQYQELTAIMTAQGIDVAAIEEVIRNFFNGA